MSLVFSCDPREHQKTSGILTFLERMDREQLHENFHMSSDVCTKCLVKWYDDIQNFHRQITYIICNKELALTKYVQYMQEQVSPVQF